MKNRVKIKTRMIAKTVMVAALSVVAVAAITELVPAVHVIPSAYAQTATGSSAITEGACSNGSFADNFLASSSSSCAPDFSGSSAGYVALCMGDDYSISLAIKGTCSTSN